MTRPPPPARHTRSRPRFFVLQVPYGDLNYYSIMWLVAKHGMRLHIPDSCPERYFFGPEPLAFPRSACPPCFPLPQADQPDAPMHDARS